MAAVMRVREPGVFARASWPWRVAAVAAALATGGLLAMVIANWGWRWLGPTSAPPVADAIPATWSPAIIAAAPFGRAPVAASGPAATAGPSLPPDTKLLGVFASRGGEGYALLRLPDRGAVLIKKGERIVGDVTLVAVDPDGIRIDDHGDTRSIPLRPTGSPAPAPTAARTARTVAPTRAVANAAPARSAACSRPAGFTGQIFRLNAELLAGMVAKPDSWSTLVAPVGGALVVRDESGLATMLGMKVGDRVAQANGISLVAIDDVLTAVVRPLAASQPVRITGTRDGKPREWLFLNAGACPP